MMNDAARGPPEGQMAAAAVPSDPGKILPKGTGKRSVTNRDCASLQQGAALSKKRAKSSAEETTAEKNPTLGEDCLDAILAFLPVDHLVILRSLSKDTKATVDKMVRKRAQQFPSLDLDLWYYEFSDDENRINVHQGWTEALLDRESVIELAIQMGHLTSDFDPCEIELARCSLRRDGIAASDKRGSDVEEWSQYYRKVEWNDALDVSTALRAITTYFRHVEQGMKWENYEEFSNCYKSMKKEERNILLAKETAVSLLLTNVSNTVGFSKIEGDDSYSNPENWADKKYEILAFRLDNEMEIFFKSYFYDPSDEGDY